MLSVLLFCFVCYSVKMKRHESEDERSNEDGGSPILKCNECLLGPK